MIEIELKEIKGINQLKLSLPFDKGLYAITGENGIGKSTIFSALSKLVYRSALQTYFRNDGSLSSRITYRLNGNENTWEKQIGWKRTDPANPEIFLDGFYEGSLIFGSRFSDAHTSRISKTIKIKPTDVCDADPFVVESLGEILRNNKSFYNGLRKVKSKTIASSLGFGGIPYVMERNGKWLHHFNMSSGEFLLIGLLHFINERIKYKSKREISDLSLIIMDEIELALHPSSQDRLAIFLNMVSAKYNFCIYFATHSVQIISNVRPEKIYHIAMDIAGGIEVTNPCYPAYATRCLHTADGFDFILLVEDELAKFFVEKAIKDGGTQTSKLIKILPCGGWEKTLELQEEMSKSRLAGKGCKIISILDGDIEQEYISKHGSGTKYAPLPKSFLPIKSLEKYLKEKLIKNPDPIFAKAYGDIFFNVRSLTDIINDYKSDDRSARDNNGKGLFLVLKQCALEQGHSEETYKRETCTFIANHENLTSLSTSLASMCR